MTQKKKVALVEDNEDCREILATMIRLMGYELIVPLDSEVDETIDVIVVYLDFPQMHILGTIRALRDDQRTKNIPIIGFLPWPYREGTLATLDAGANDVFDGPLTFEALGSAIEKYAPDTSHQCDSAPTTKMRVA
jgi:DNA-binding response OmpR family regulator